MQITTLGNPGRAANPYCPSRSPVSGSVRQPETSSHRTDSAFIFGPDISLQDFNVARNLQAWALQLLVVEAGDRLKVNHAKF